MKNIIKPFQIIFRISPISTFFYILFTFASGLIPTFFVYINQNFIDSVLDYANGLNSLNNLISACYLMVIVLILPLILARLSGVAEKHVSRNLYKKFDLELIQKKINLKYEALEEKNTQLILQKMNDPKGSIMMVARSTCDMLKFSISSIGLSIYLTNLNIWFLPVLVALFIISLTVQTLKRNRDIKTRWYNAEHERLRQSIKWIFFDNSTQQEIRTFTNNDYLMKKYDEQTDKVTKIKLSAERKNNLGKLFIHVATLASMAYIMFSIIYGVIDGLYSVGILASALGAVTTFTNQSRQIGNAAASMVNLKAEMKYYNEFMALPNREAGTELLPKKLEIEFKDVCFSYPGTEKEILKNINLVFSPNKNTAIVGENGSGKSTIVKLLAGLYKPTSGTITVGGIDINKLSDAERFKLFGFVFQDINFYHVMFRENIAVGDKNKLYDDVAIKNSLKNAGAYELLNKIDGNLNTTIGWMNEQGITFSGGEQQRMQISRAFLAPHKFVVLDEPVASLDAFAESKMYESFLSFFKNKGVIVISHRLASAKMADEIFMLEDGNVAAIGTHEELMKTNKLYKTMFTLQASHYKDDNKIRKDKNGKK